jgi:hypothetical protein
MDLNDGPGLWWTRASVDLDLVDLGFGGLGLQWTWASVDLGFGRLGLRWTWASVGLGFGGLGFR